MCGESADRNGRSLPYDGSGNERGEIFAMDGGVVVFV